MNHLLLRCYHKMQKLTICVDQNTIRIENQKMIFVYPLDLTTQLKWQFKEGKMYGFTIKNTQFTADPEILDEFKSRIAGKITFRSLYNFYQVIQQSGQGGFSSVYDIKPIESLSGMTLRSLVAKRIDKSHIEIQKIHEEIKILLRCQSPNVVQLLEVYENELSVFIVMEKLNHINIRNLGFDQASKYAKEIISAIFDLHKQGIIHRDIKYYNIMVDHNDHIKILDFGLACLQKLCSEKCGTFGYMAPEIISQAKYDQKCDVYSVGVFLYQLFYYLYNKQMINIINFEEQTLFSNIPTSIKLFLERLLKVNPKERLSSEQAFFEIQFVFEIEEPLVRKIVKI